MRQALTWVSLLETISFVALLGAMAMNSEGGVSVIGAVHGVLFLAYAVLLWAWRDALGWSTRFAALAILTGPVGAVVALERLRRERVAAVR